MSSILEALKKLEAEKNAHMLPAEEPVTSYSGDFSGDSLLGSLVDSPSRGNRLVHLTLVMAGGMMAVLVITVSVLVVLLFVQRAPVLTVGPAVSAPATAVPAPTAPESIAAAISAEAAEDLEVGDAPVEQIAAALPEAPEEAPVAREPPPKPAPKAPAPREAEASRMVSLPADVRYERYIPESPAGTPARTSALPEDIRTLPMLSRNERAQYRLENLDLNMLNEANAVRPTGNAIINLEKVFIGETLPGSNARLVDVQSHGIAIEILSTRQHYYIPR